MARRSLREPGGLSHHLQAGPAQPGAQGVSGTEAFREIRKGTWAQSEPPEHSCARHPGPPASRAHCLSPLMSGTPPSRRHHTWG